MELTSVALQTLLNSLWDVCMPSNKTQIADTFASGLAETRSAACLAPACHWSQDASSQTCEVSIQRRRLMLKL